MKPEQDIQLLGGLLDLPVIDRDHRYCGAVDDIELEGIGGNTRVKALIVGPGGYRGRLPRWAYAIVRQIAGNHVTHVPWEVIEEIGSAVILRVTADEFGLHRVENRARALLPKAGAL